MLVIRTPPDNVAFSIALGFVFVSHILHPIVELLFARVRAYRAWRTVEKQEAVEVTHYNLLAEILGDRGRWDTPRILTLLLCLFSVAALGLELSMDLAIRTDGPVDLLNRPPPIVYSAGSIDTDWTVQAATYGVPEAGTLDNFEGSLENGQALATYRVGDEGLSGLIHGNTLFAWWSTVASSAASGLYYDRDDGKATVEGISCVQKLRTAAVYLELEGTSEMWGSVTECESGPKLADVESIERNGPPTILLNSSTGNVHLLVEEESSYPSFLYSVWKPEAITTPTLVLQHVFYIATTVRLAEAVVTGIVNGIENGGGCVDLLAQHSVFNKEYRVGGKARVSPFGEHPGNNSEAVAALDQVEPIVAGVSISIFGTICGGLILVVTAGALVGCLCFHSTKCLDVYNRDQIIRAVSLPNGGEAVGKAGRRHALRIFVRRQAGRSISIIISDDGKYRGYADLRQRCASCVRKQVVDESSAPGMGESTNSSNERALPPGCREITIEGVRPILNAAHVPHKAVHTPRSQVVELIASPVPVGDERRKSILPPFFDTSDEEETDVSQMYHTPPPHIPRLCSDFFPSSPVAAKNEKDYAE